MKVKVGDTWYKADPGQPIMVQFNRHDRVNIFNMAPGANRYAVFAEDSSDEESIAARRAWMDEGYVPDEPNTSPLPGTQDNDEVYRLANEEEYNG